MKPNVLVVEDDRALCRSLTRTLKAHFNVTYVHDCVAALKVAEETPLDAVVVDLELPDGDGLTLVHQLRGSGYSGPVLVASGSATEPAVGFARWSSTVQSALRKPFSPKQLIAALLRQLKVGQAEASML